MVEKLAQRETAELLKEFAGLVEKNLTVEKDPIERKVWLIGREMKIAIMVDALKFYDKLGPVTKDEGYRKLLALQLALDNNKCAVNVFRTEGAYGKDVRIRLRDLETAREITGVEKVRKPAEYVDSHASFLVKTGLLSEEEGRNVAKFAKKTLLEYENRKSNPIGTPINVSAAAVYYASYKVGTHLSIVDLEEIFGVTRQTLSPRSSELVEIAVSKDEAQWFEYMKRRAVTGPVRKA